MPINLTVQLNQSGAIAHRIRYARIDNTVTPSYVVVTPDVPNTPNLVYNIAENIPNGQYRIGYKAIYSDLRECAEQFTETAACPILTSLNAYLDGNNIVVEYLAPSDVVKVKINISYPNGGSYSALYVNNGDNIAISLPSNVYGDFFVTGQSVCDEDSGFYSPLSSQVILNRTQTNTNISNQSSELTITGITGINGYTFSVPIPPAGTSSGSHVAFLDEIVMTLTTSGVFTGNIAKLYLNGTLIQCQAITSGSVSFSPAGYAETDLINITIEEGVCV